MTSPYIQHAINSSFLSDTQLNRHAILLPTALQEMLLNLMHRTISIHRGLLHIRNPRRKPLNRIRSRRFNTSNTVAQALDLCKTGND